MTGYIMPAPGCGSAWLERWFGTRRSQVRILSPRLSEICASGSVVEYRLAKARVAGSNPSRALLFYSRRPNMDRFSGLF